MRMTHGKLGKNDCLLLTQQLIQCINYSEYGLTMCACMTILRVKKLIVLHILLFAQKHHQI